MWYRWNFYVENKYHWSIDVLFWREVNMTKFTSLNESKFEISVFYSIVGYIFQNRTFLNTIFKFSKFQVPSLNNSLCVRPWRIWCQNNATSRKRRWIFSDQIIYFKIFKCLYLKLFNTFCLFNLYKVIFLDSNFSHALWIFNTH